MIKNKDERYFELMVFSKVNIYNWFGFSVVEKWLWNLKLTQFWRIVFFLCTYPNPGAKLGKAAQTSLGLQLTILIKISGLPMESLSAPSGKQYSVMKAISGISGGLITVESFAWHIL